MSIRRCKKTVLYLLLFSVISTTLSCSFPDKESKIIEQIAPSTARAEISSAAKDTLSSRSTAHEEEEDDRLTWLLTLPFADVDPHIRQVQVIWENLINRLLTEKNASYRIKIEIIPDSDPQRVLLPHEGSDFARILDYLHACKQSGKRVDLITIGGGEINPESPESYSNYPYRDAARDGLLMNLNDFIKSAAAENIRKSIPAREIKKAEIDGVLFGLGTFPRSLSAIAYDVGRMKKHDIQEKDIESELFANEALFEKVRQAERKAPLQLYPGTLHYSLGICRIHPAKHLAFTAENGFCNYLELPIYRETLIKLLDWKKKGLLSVITPHTQQNEACFASLFPGLCHRDEAFFLSPSVYDLALPFDYEYYVVPDKKAPLIDLLWGDKRSCIASWTKRPEEALDFLSRIFTDPDFANLIQYRRAGEDFELRDGLAIVPLEEQLLSLSMPQFGNNLISYPTATTMPDKLAFQEYYFENYEAFVPDGFRFDPRPVLAEVMATNHILSVQDMSPDVESLFTLSGDPLKALDSLILRLKDAGMDRIIAEASRQMEAWRKKVEP